MHCSKCGKEISEDSKICIYCDEKTSKVMDIVKGRKQLIIVVAVLMSILIAIFIAIISASQKNTVNVEDAAAAIKEEYAVLIGYGTENVNPLITTLYTGFEVQVVEIEKTQDRYIANCIFSNFDVVGAFVSLSETGSEMMYKDYIQELTKTIGEQPRLTSETEIIITIDESGGYQIYFTEDQLDTAMGGFLSYYKEINRTEVSK